MLGDHASHLGLSSYECLLQPTKNPTDVVRRSQTLTPNPDFPLFFFLISL